MVDYKHAWKVRLIQIIIVNVIFLFIGISMGISEKSILAGLEIWFFGSWITETIISLFNKNGDKVSSLARNVVASVFSGMFAASSGGSSLFVFFFVIALIKVMVGMLVLGVILVFEFVAFPITTIYLFIKSRDEKVEE